MDKLSRSDQARLNGAKSNGPVTDEGKQRSSQNSLKHGLTARNPVLLSNESEDEFEQLRAEYHELFAPDGAVERDLVDQLILNRFRYRRFTRYEAAALEAPFTMTAQHAYPLHDDTGDPLAHQLRNLTSSAGTFHLMERYLSNLERGYLRTLKALEERQRLRKESAPNPEVAGHIFEDPNTGKVWKRFYLADYADEYYETNPDEDPPKAKNRAGFRRLIAKARPRPAALGA